MIDDLDISLEELLKLELPQDLVSQITISFAAPDNQFPPVSVALPAIDLFLYDLRENREARTSEWRLERNGDGPAIRKAPPVRVDCSYLITAWPSDGSTTPALDEHRLLGEVMKVLLRFPMLPPAVLHGSLAGQEPPLPTAALQAGRIQSVSELWQALGGKPKAALSYTVTIGVEPDLTTVAGPPVLEKVLRLQQGAGERS